MKLKCIVNNCDTKFIADIISFARSIFNEKGFEIEPDFIFVNEPLEFTNYWIGRGLTMYSTNKYSTDSIGSHTIVYFYNPLKEKDLYNWTYVVDGKPQVQIPCNPQVPTTAIGECLAHELTHSFFANLKEKGINLADNLDFNNEGLKSIREKLTILSPFKAQIELPMPCDKKLTTMQTYLKSLQDFLASLTNKKPLKDLATAMSIMEGFPIVGSRPYRNHNPLNLKYCGQKLAIGKDDKNFCIFKNDEDGWITCLNDLRCKRDGKSISGLNGNSTIEQLIKVWSETDQNEYVNFVCKKLKVAKDYKIGNFYG